MLTSANSGQVPQVLRSGRFEVLREVPVATNQPKFYEGCDTETDETVAIRLEKRRLGGQLGEEARILQALASPSLPQGFCAVRFWGLGSPSWNCLVTERLGKSLWHHMKDLGELGPQNTVLVAKQILHRIEYLHSKGIVYRDVTPRNFVFGIDRKAHHLHLVDFGLSRAYWTQDQPGRHVIQKSGNEIVGALSYMSISAHHRLEQSRRDDIEAVGHMLVGFMGKLPWANVESLSQEEKSRKILQQKESIPVRELCRGLPPPIEHLLASARGLTFTARPDYWDLGTRFSTVRKQMGLQHHQFTWLAGTAGANPAGLEPLIKPQRPKQPDDHLVVRSSTLLSSFSRSGSGGKVKGGKCLPLPCGGSPAAASPPDALAPA